MNSEVDPHKYPGPLEELEKRSAPKKTAGPQLAISVGILVK